MSFYVISKKGIIVNLHISPNAPKTYICGIHGDSIKIKLKAPPVDGKANRTLIKFINKIFKKYSVKSEITAGKTSKDKRILLKNFTDTKVVEMIFNNSEEE